MRIIRSIAACTPYVREIHPFAVDVSHLILVNLIHHYHAEKGHISSRFRSPSLPGLALPWRGN
jgi:hypothetical protein